MILFSRETSGWATDLKIRIELSFREFLCVFANGYFSDVVQVSVGILYVNLPLSFPLIKCSEIR